MRIVLATDGSPSSAQSVDLVRSLPLPAGSCVEVLTVLPKGSHGARVEDRLTADAEAMLRAACTDLKQPGVSVDYAIARGRPASEIVSVAAEQKADLIVLGSRGRGPWRSALLGSVSAEVADHAPCAVLVARRPVVTRAVLGIDGTSRSKEAAAFLARWPALSGQHVRVVSVAQVADMTAIGFAAPVSGEIIEDLLASRVEAEKLAREESSATAARLAEGGLPTGSDVRVGDPAHELIAAATAGAADLIVVGTSGVTGLTRAVLGSVARNVLLHATCSVLVVRHPGKAT